MARVALTAALLASLTAIASADKLYLTDGRTFTGTVAVKGDTVHITVPYGTLRFSKSVVERIELKDTPEQEFRKRLGETALDDPNALSALAGWAAENALERQANDLYTLILKLDADHPRARRALGFIRINKQWMTFGKALELARGRMEAGSYAALLADILPALKAAANTKARHMEVAELLAHTQLRSKRFAEAAEAFALLAEQADPPRSARAAAIIRILEENADGMYVLREAYPPTAGLLGDARPSIEPGPASLANPVVLDAALRDRAKQEISAGRELMDEARTLDATDPDAGAAKYARAEQAFQRADALVPDIARSYLVEIIRRRVAAIRKDADGNARKFDEQMGNLGVRDLSPKDYKNMILRLIHHLDGTRADLQRILELAAPYPRELVLEIKWAEFGLTKIENMRKILVTELDGRK